jgi:hypothetical protein
MMMTAIASLIATMIQGTAGEWVAQASVPGFATAFHDEGAGGMITEQVPNGETVERWTRMITVQRFTGAAQRLSPEDLLANMASGLVTSCPGARTSEVFRLTVSGRPAARFRADCPRNPSTRLPETFTALAIAGAGDLHVAQVAFRRVPSAADDAWAERQIASVALCTATNKAAVCSAR